MPFLGRPMLLAISRTPVLALSVFLAISAGACTAPREELYGANDPSIRIPAMKKAAQSSDHAALAKLVQELDSDDPAVRFFAIHTLERLTGTRLDYVYYADDDQRKPAVARWQQWLARQDGSAAPAPAAPTVAKSPQSGSSDPSIAGGDGSNGAGGQP